MKITALGLAVLMILAVMALLPTAMAQEVPAHVVMSEVFYDESGDDNNEFCELYNPTDSDIDISGWKLKAFNQTGTLKTTTTLPAGTIITAHKFYLIGEKDPLNSGDWGGTAISPDCIRGGTDWQNGPDDYLVLEDGTGTYVDGVRWGHSNGYNPPAIPDVPDNHTAPDVIGKSIERKSLNGGYAPCQDTNDNSIDFFVQDTPTPKNSASPEMDPAPVELFDAAGNFKGGFAKIQGAVDSAVDGDTVLVHDGTYNENVDVTKSHLTIRSENGPSVTTVSASLNPDEHVFNITDQTDVTLDGFEIRDAYGANKVVAGIYMKNASDCHISNNVVTNISATGIADEAYGLSLENSNKNSFTDTTISNVAGQMAAAGISLFASNDNTFDPTEIENVEGTEGSSGVFLFASNSTSFTDTTISNVAGQMAAGISLIASNDNTFDPTEIENVNGIYTAAGVYLDFANNNVFSETKVHEVSSHQSEKSFGFYLMESSSNNVTDGEIFNCARGTRIDSGRYNTIERNIIRDNFDTGVLLDGSASYTEIHTNCFYNNIRQAMDNGANNNWTGNYWSDYIPPGPYNISGAAGSKDNEPLDECPLGEGLPPNITSFAPPSPVNDTVCTWRTFNVTVNQTVNVSWYLNGTAQVPKNVSVTEANFSFHAQYVGVHNVSAVAENANGMDMQTWVWNVAPGPLPVLEINKTDNPDPVSRGGILNYSIHVNNVGDATATNVTVTETYDENVTFVSAVPAPSQDSDTWKFPTLNVGESKWIHISVAVNASVLNETVLHNFVNVTCDEGVTDSDTEDTTVLSLPVCIETATGTGIACFETDAGTIEDLVAVDEATLPEEGKPALVFLHGFFSFDITGLTPGQTAVVTITLPDNMPVGTQYWKYHASEGGWIQIPMGSNDGDPVITITLVDGGLGDDDGTANGVIVDQGGPGMSLGISVNKVANPPDVAPSSNVEFTITVSNTGDCTLDPVRVVDTLSGWMSYVSSSPAADTHDGTIIWNNVGPLDPGDSKTITLVARIASGASGSVTNTVTIMGTNLTTGVNVTGSDTVTVTVLARTIEPPTKTLIDVTTEVKSDRTVIEGEQFGWETGNGNLLNNPPISPGEAVGSIKYDDKMIGSNGTTEFTKNFGVNTNITPNLAVTKDIGYKSGDLGSLSNDEQVGMRYSGASPPLSSTTKCEDVNTYSKMVVTDVSAATETEVGITETDERDLHYGIDAEGKGSVSAGVDASTSSMAYKDKSMTYGSNFSLHKKVDYTSKPSTSITTDLKGDSTVVEEGQFRGERGSRSLLHNDKMIGSNGTTEFEKCVDASTSNLAVAKSIGYKSGDLGSLSYSEQVGMRYSSTTKCEGVNAYGKMVVTNATTETEVGITERSLYYGIDAECTGSVAAGVDAFVDDGHTDMTYEDKSNAYGNFTFEKRVGYKSNPP